MNVRKNEAAARKKQEQQVLQAFLKRACGYVAKEEVHELKDIKNEDGSVKRELVLTKVVSKEVPPDLAAARWYLERQGISQPQQEAGMELEEARSILQRREQLMEEAERERGTGDFGENDSKGSSAL